MQVIICKCRRGNARAMMTTTSYLLALTMYWLAAGLGCRLLYLLWFRRFSPYWSAAMTGLMAGILLAPAYATGDANTLAPALITGLFNLLFAGGVEAATGAFLMLFVGALVGVLAGVLSVRLSTSRPR